mmetsp:Transcript_60710/g.71034  ORF Transcript_60710/g.71034 Transcript_60710/m.71034 type:complete len:94 (-) Transcript_60710:384-665(-)
MQEEGRRGSDRQFISTTSLQLGQNSNSLANIVLGVSKRIHKFESGESDPGRQALVCVGPMDVACPLGRHGRFTADLLLMITREDNTRLNDTFI